MDSTDRIDFTRNDPFGESNVGIAIRQALLPPNGRSFVGARMLQAGGWVVVGLPVEVVD